MATGARGRVLELIGQRGNGLMVRPKGGAREIAHGAMRHGLRAVRHVRWYVSHHTSFRG